MDTAFFDARILDAWAEMIDALGERAFVVSRGLAVEAREQASKVRDHATKRAHDDREMKVSTMSGADLDAIARSFGLSRTRTFHGCESDDGLRHRVLCALKTQQKKQPT